MGQAHLHIGGLTIVSQARFTYAWQTSACNAGNAAQNLFLVSVAAKGTTFLKATHSLALTTPIHVYSAFPISHVPLCATTCPIVVLAALYRTWSTYIRCLAGYWLPFTAGASEETCSFHGT